ncbi:MAG TPA: hypothetical protein PKD02_08640, partial [Thermomonas sp.]|nr:hypothetical protein [Thermomonas sp.]
MIRIFGGCRRRQQSRQRRLLARLGGCSRFCCATLRFQAFGLGAGCGDALRFQAFGLGAGCGDALRFQAFGLRAGCGDTLRFQAFGLRALGFQARRFFFRRSLCRR